MKEYSLTPEHRAAMAGWSKKWIDIGLSTAPMGDNDRALCRDAVVRMYAAAKLPPPKNIVFVASPFILRFASGFAAAIWWRRKNLTRAVTLAATHAATLDATHAATHAATHDATLDATRAVTLAATDDATLDATRDATLDATRAATLAATYAATHAATIDATLDATDDATLDATRDATLAATHDATLDATHAATHDATHAATRAATLDEDNTLWYRLVENYPRIASGLGLGESGLRCAQSIWGCYQGGNYWAGWHAWLGFFRHVVHLPIDYTNYDPVEILALHSSVRIVHPDFCMISDRPERLLIDSENRPHCDDGPFCRWRDGSALYAVHGVRVPAYVVESPMQITIDKIRSERNAEVRRVMLDRFGADRYLAGIGATPIHSDEFGKLYRSEMGDDEPLVMVEVINATPELDGTCKKYFLRVPPNVSTAREAVAWTFGKNANEYKPVAES